MNREWVEAGARALANKYVGRWTVAGREEAAVVIDAVEPLIRADERERYECPMPCCDDYDPVPSLVARGVMSNEHDPDSCEADCCRERATLVDLRAKVDGLSLSGTSGERYGFDMARRAVLALFDEATQ